MRIAYIRSSLLTGSGLVNHMMQIISRVSLAGNDVAIISRESKINTKTNDITILKLRFVGDSIPFLRNLVFPFSSLKILKKFDLIHTQYHPGIFAGTIAANFLQKPHVFTYHGFSPIRSWRNYKQKLKMIDHRIGTFLALRSDVSRIITVSQFLKKELMKKYFVHEDKIRVIYNGVDVKRFNPNLCGENIRKFYGLDNSPVVLYLGRLSPYKGIQFLIKAVPKVLTEIPTAKFLVGGAMRYDIADIGRLIRDSKARKAITFTGYVSNQRVPELYAACNVFCYPSLWEGFGLTPAEAQACGKPVVEPKNIEALAKALISFLQNKEKCIQFGKRARQRIMKLFSWGRAAQQTLQIYDEVLT